MATTITLKSKNPGPSITIQSLGGIVVPANGGTYSVVPNITSEVGFMGIYGDEIAALVISEDIRLVVNGREIVDPATAALAASSSSIYDLIETPELDVIQTTDAAPITLSALTLEENTAYHVEAVVVAEKADHSQRASYRLSVTAYRTDGDAVLRGSVTLLHAQKSDPDWDADFTVSGNDLRVTVMGKVDTTVNWKGRLSYIRE